MNDPNWDGLLGAVVSGVERRSYSSGTYKIVIRFEDGRLLTVESGRESGYPVGLAISVDQTSDPRYVLTHE